MRPAENHDALAKTAGKCSAHGLRGIEGWLLVDAVIDCAQEIEDVVA